MEQSHWSDKTWIEEDKLFQPKRRVDNKISWQRPHLIGGFRSRKMKRRVEYHSLNECFFYYYLELDKSTIRYYVQPIEVSIPVISAVESNKSWKHVPDVLVFRNGSKPLLYQIKESPEDVGGSFNQCNKRCELLASNLGWNYDVIYPKNLPDIVLRNINYLHGNLRERRHYTEDLINDVLFKLRFDQPITVGELARSFYPKHHPNDVKPLIYHLIAVGKIEVNVFEEVGSHSLIRISSDTNGHPIGRLLFGEGKTKYENESALKQ
ncbi:hypothetical protein ACHHV8_02555 [Paenibacillus sp. TAB 01]|uniref:hypothetical protein n=1 Tax=Paenibacillus sp. TAB 01 TaxID=3368988 RepID=UPI00375189D6